MSVFLTQPVFATATDDPELVARLRAMLMDNLGWPIPPRFPEAPAVSRLDEIAVPVLIVLGEASASDAHDAADLMEQDVPDVRIVQIPGAGHMVNLEAPEAFNRAVRGFLDEVSSIQGN